MQRIDAEGRVYLICGPRYFSGLRQWQPQVAGGFLNGARILGFPVAEYGTSGWYNNLPDVRDWMVVYGVDYLLVGGKESQDWIRDWKDPGKFVGKMRQVWEDGDDRLYAVERWNQSLAHVVPMRVMMRRTPVAFAGNVDLQEYAKALEGGANRGGVWEWDGLSGARVRASLEAGDAIATQVAFDSRWEARVDGRVVRTERDGLGQMWIEPGRTGAVEVALQFRNPWWVWAPSVVGVILLVIIFLRGLTRFALRGRVSK
jgi:hypothetical protein